MLVPQLKAFFTVARLGSVTLAAKQLSLSQPTVTSQIRSLEEHYGIELFRRQGGRLSLSDEGIRLLPLVEKLLQQELNVEFALRQSAEAHRGSLRLGATAPYYVLDIMREHKRRFPLVDVSLTLGNSRQMIDAMLEYRVDLCTSSHLEVDKRLHRIELGSDPLVLVARRDDPLARRTAVPLTELEGLALIMREQGSITRALTEQALARAGVTPRSLQEIASREAIREAVLRGMGVSIFARHEISAHPDLSTIALTDDIPPMMEYLYCLTERRESRLIDAFLQSARAGVSP